MVENDVEISTGLVESAKMQTDDTCLVKVRVINGAVTGEKTYANLYVRGNHLSIKPEDDMTWAEKEAYWTPGDQQEQIELELISVQ